MEYNSHRARVGTSRIGRRSRRVLVIGHLDLFDGRFIEILVLVERLIEVIIVDHDPERVQQEVQSRPVLIHFYFFYGSLQIAGNIYK